MGKKYMGRIEIGGNRRGKMGMNSLAIVINSVEELNFLYINRFLSSLKLLVPFQIGYYFTSLILCNFIRVEQNIYSIFTLLS